jgi:tetratricopeptide (TPR) repeat protein
LEQTMKQWWFFTFVASSLGLGMPLPAMSKASDSTEALCEQHWIKDSSGSAIDSEEQRSRLLERWSQRRAECGSTASYWGRKATIETQQGATLAARESIRQGQRVGPAGNQVVELAEIMINVQERLLSSTPVTDVDLERFEAAYRRLVAKYPRWPAAHAMLGGVQTLRSRYQDAVDSLNEAANGTDFQLWGVYRNLTVSLSALGRHSEAATAAGKAFGENKAVLNDSEFACALAISLTEIGKVADAESVLQLLVMRQPAVQSEPEFLRAKSIVEAEASRVDQRR